VIYLNQVYLSHESQLKCNFHVTIEGFTRVRQIPQMLV